MNLTPKDTVGILLVAGTLGTLFVHTGPDAHAPKGALGDGGGSVTTAVVSNTVAFVDVNVLPMEQDEVLWNQVVIVEGNFVRQIGKVGEVVPPVGAVIIPGNGTRYLVPGLTDAHVHLEDDAEDWLRLFVANGVTTVFNLRGEGRHLELRDRVRSGEVLGPAIYTSGPFTNQQAVETPEQAERWVRDQERDGYDFVKLHGDLSEATYRRLVQIGNEVEIPIVGHASRNLPLRVALETGQASLTHAEELIYTRFSSLEVSDLERVAGEIAAAGTWVTPTMSNFSNNETQWGTTEGLRARLDSEAGRYAPRSMLARWGDRNVYTAMDPSERSRIREMFEFQRPLIVALGRAGVPMLTGSDAGLPVMVPGFSLHEEIDAMEQAGLASYSVLQAATRNAGRFVREFVDEHANFGTVTQGARADLLLLEDDPLLDLSRLRRPAGVMVRGRWYDRAALDEMLEQMTGN